MIDINPHTLLIAQMAATLLAGEIAAGHELIREGNSGSQAIRDMRAIGAVQQARAIFKAATKGGEA
jgi:hypothetical protein